MNDFLVGMKKSIPIALGYLAVSFAFGVMAIQGLTPFMATILSLTNLTSSGQFAGVKMMLEAASVFEIGITVLLINLRYSLMSISLSQKIDSQIPTWKRLIFGFGITDEVYAVASTEKSKISSSYMFGIMILPIVSWSLGTLIGCIASSLINETLLNALGITLYAMFISIIIPDAKKSKAITIVIAIAIIVSCIFNYVPYINTIGVGFKIIISTIIASLVGSILYPHKEEC